MKTFDDREAAGSELIDAPARDSEVDPETTDDSKIRAILAFHLGSNAAADAWLNSTGTGYPSTALEAIHQGHALLVLEDIESQWGPSPSYA